MCFCVHQKEERLSLVFCFLFWTCFEGLELSDRLAFLDRNFTLPFLHK